MKYVVLFVIMIPLILGFLYIWKKNHETPIPKEAFDAVPKCNGCVNKSCSNYNDNNKN